MKYVHRLVTIVIGLIVLAISYNLWVDSGIFTSMFLPNPPEGFDSFDGALKAGNPEAVKASGIASLMAKAVELLLTLITTVGSVGIMTVTKLIPWLANPIEAVMGELQVDTDDSKPPVKGYKQYVMCLNQAVIDGDTDMCTAVMNKIHGKKFVNCQRVSEGGFPENGSNQ